MKNGCRLKNKMHTQQLFRSNMELHQMCIVLMGIRITVGTPSFDLGRGSSTLPSPANKILRYKYEKQWLFQK